MLLNTSLDLNKNDSIPPANMMQKSYWFVVLVIFLLCSSWAQADGLFDFQMKLAKKGNAEAEFKIGEMYETGFGVKKDQRQAEVWINKAAAQGHETAGFKLLFWDIRENGINDDNKKKLADLRGKATNGHPLAMYYVGSMYAHGVGVKKNYDKALDWLNKATYVGVLEAEREATRVREMKQSALAKNRKAEAQRKAKEKAAQGEAKKLEAQRKTEEQAKVKAAADKKAQDVQKQSVQQKKLENQKNKEVEAKRQAEAGAAAKKKADAEAKAIADQKKQALLKKQAEQKKKQEKESKFESDPCKGRSARFLSNCR